MFKDRRVVIEEIQEATGFSLSYIRQLTRNGKLKGERVGRRYYYNAGQVNKALNLQLKVREKEDTLAEIW